MQKYVFLLGREPLLSMAEIQSLFPSVERSGDFALVQAEKEDIEWFQNGLGWTIKIALVLGEWLKKTELLSCIISEAIKKVEQGKKLRIGIDMFVPSMSSLVFKAKDALKVQWHSVRVVQHDWWRLKTATTIHEKLIEQGIEFIVFSDKEGFTVAQTVWIQDIESYTERDIDRDRSMTVGMMPPKIAQIMISLGTQGKKDTVIWDPFCGLGTTLIEALHGWYRDLLGSDLASEMVDITRKNIEKQPWYNSHNIDIFRLDATQIESRKLSSSTIVVTEGMLGKNFTSTNITHEWILAERKHLTELYQAFLDSAYKNTHIKKMVFCLPFWNIGRETIYMPDMTQLSKAWWIDALSRSSKRYLFHLRPWQCVGREIIVASR